MSRPKEADKHKPHPMPETDPVPARPGDPAQQPHNHNEIPVPPSEPQPVPISDPPSPAEHAPIDEGPKGPKAIV